MTRYLFLPLLVLAAGCSNAFVVQDPLTGAPLAKCYDGRLTSFCQVAAPPGTVVINGQGIVAAAISAVGPAAGNAATLLPFVP